MTLNSTQFVIGTILAVLGILLLLQTWRLRAAGQHAVPPSLGTSGLFSKWTAGRSAGQGACAVGACTNDEGWLCAYREASGRKCGTRWCKDHVVFVGSIPYCHRHAAVVNALKGTEGTILQVKRQPTLEDRAVPLLMLICNQADRAILAFLAEQAHGDPVIQVSRQSTVSEVWVDRDRVAWQIAWGLYTNRGYLLKVAIRVGVPEPPVVQGVVANNVVFQDVPYWIRRRLQREPADPRDQELFVNRLVEDMKAAVALRMAEVLSQHDGESETFGALPAARY